MHTYLPKIYTASKIRHKRLWRGMESHWRGYVDLTARWIRQHDTPDLSDLSYWGPEERERLWIQNVQDVQRSDYVVAYAEPEDLSTVKGTLFECGVAVGLGKVVIAVGFDNHHSWSNHPLVRPMSSISHAFASIVGTFPPLEPLMEERHYENK